jgi:hypothetical protein
MIGFLVGFLSVFVGRLLLWKIMTKKQKQDAKVKEERLREAARAAQTTDAGYRLWEKQNPPPK